MSVCYIRSWWFALCPLEGSRVFLMSLPTFSWVLLLFNRKKTSFRVYIFVLSTYYARDEWWRVVYPIYRNYDMEQQRCSLPMKFSFTPAGGSKHSGAALQERWLGPRDFHNVTWFILLFNQTLEPSVVSYYDPYPILPRGFLKSRLSTVLGHKGNVVALLDRDVVTRVMTICIFCLDLFSSEVLKI